LSKGVCHGNEKERNNAKVEKDNDERNRQLIFNLTAARSGKWGRIVCRRKRKRFLVTALGEKTYGTGRW